MEEGKVYKVTIEDYDINGLGVAKMEGIVLFVEKALKDEVVLAKITSLHKKYAFARAIKVLEPIPERLVSSCPYYEGCGGCDLLHIQYKTECKMHQSVQKNNRAVEEDSSTARLCIIP